MYNYFIHIWKIIKQWVMLIQIKTWQFVGSLIALIILIYFFICIHQIERIGVEYHVMEMRGLSAKGGYATLNFNINNGLLYERDKKKYSTINILHIFDSELESLGEQNRLWMENKVGHSYDSIDSLLNVHGLDSINDNNKHIYRIDRKKYSHSRTHRKGIKLTSNNIIYNDSLMLALAHIQPLMTQRNSLLTYEHVTSTREYYIQKDSNLVFFSINMPYWNEGLNSYPNVTEPWDISQRTYKINYYSDGYNIDINPSTTLATYSANTTFDKNGNLTEIKRSDYTTIRDSVINYHYVTKSTFYHGCPQPTTPLKELKVDFGGPTEFLAMNPEPDVMTVSGFEFTDSLKLRQIMRDGIEFHAKFPQTESLQSARIFVVTTLIPIFISLVFTLGYQIIKAKHNKWKLNRLKETE